jgi:hypothetical protein
MTRFERCEDAGGSKAFSRSEVNRKLAARDAMDPGAFLARLWACFGPAGVHDGGFEYSIRDRDTGLAFSAYSGASGPSYGGDRPRRDELRPVVVAFEEMLDATAPVDCEHTFGADDEYGGGLVAIGWRDGGSFMESRDTRTKPETARTYQECVAIAKLYEASYGAWSGWHHCLDRVLPRPPDEVDWNGAHYEQNVGFSLDDDRAPVMLYIGPSEAPEPVPLDAIAFDPPLGEIAARWVDAYARWRREHPPTKKPPRRGRASP